MTRLTQTFAKVRNENRAALIGYITAGDPDLERSFEIIDAACEAGLDILELGIPFSDPTADGTIIQRASSRAIKAGMTLRHGIEFVRKLRQKHELPIILFSYYNPIFAMGTEIFVHEAVHSGADGVLCVDLPSENSDEIMQFVQQPVAQNDDKNVSVNNTDTVNNTDNRFHFIRLIAPTTDAVRRNEILHRADGFVYIVSRRGVTGGNSNKIDWKCLEQEISEMRCETKIPLCVGFGISTPDDVQAAGTIADGVVIGSAFQRIIEEHPNTAKQSVADFITILTTADKRQSNCLF
ncbi:MAG: tryptophan synthase subunit alpha [Planctomycetaceae bacterium]|jgi:tryptophan synthase alpha chain|nr:tryptophan synthase subunit alpha [Planctomycetaceae bacterium]